MKTALHSAVLVVVVVLLATTARSEPTISASEAINHVGEQVTVCGTVASSHYASRSHGQPTFLNLDRPHPKHIFTVVIFGSNRSKFGAPELTYRRRSICVSGKIKMHKGRPELVVYEPSQIRVRN